MPMADLKKDTLLKEADLEQVVGGLNDNTVVEYPASIPIQGVLGVKDQDIRKERTRPVKADSAE